MAASTKEKGVLKLVHPGRHVEILTQPITAAEVMKRNPRHCVARPDVFKFPWIVVKPESVLFPGKKFYIVPKRTIYNLLKAREQNNQPNSRQNPSPINHNPRHLTMQTGLPRKSSPGFTPKHKNRNHYFGKPVRHKLWEGVSSEEENSDHSYNQRSFVGSWPELRVKNRHMHQRFKHENLMDSTAQITTCPRKEYHHNRRSIPKILPENHDPNREIKYGTQEKMLKSCLRKKDSIRKTRNPRVTFANPIITGVGEAPAFSQNF